VNHRRGTFPRDLQYAKFSSYGFLKNLRFFEPFLILFFLEKGMTYFEIGSLYAIRELAVNILEIPTGVVADALGRRRTMVLSFVAYLLSFAVFYFGSGFTLVAAGMIVFAFGDAFRTGTHKAMIMTYLRLNGLESYKTDYYGHTRGWSQTGSAVSSLMAAAIVFYTGRYASVFLFSTVPYIADLILMLTYPKELDGNLKVFSGASLKKQFVTIWQGLVETARKRKGLRVVMSVSIFGGYYKAAKDFLQPIVAAMALSLPLLTQFADQQREAVFVGVIYSIIFFLTAAASRNAYRISKRFHHPLFAMDIELLIGLLAGFGVGMLYLYQSTIAAVILFVAIYVIQNMRKPLGVSAISDVVPEDVLATMLSVESQVQSLFAALLALAIGGVATIAGGSVGVAMLVVSGGLVLLWPLFRMPRSMRAPGGSTRR